MDQNEMSSLYRGPSIEASYQVSYHLAKWFFLIGQFKKIFYSEAAWSNGLKHGRKHL
jgi:hypothetical protein